jgi:hypothetical protein
MLISFNSLLVWSNDLLRIKRRSAEIDQTVAEDLCAWTMQTFAYLQRRLNVEQFQWLLLVVTIVAGALVGIYAVLPESSRNGGYSARNQADDLQSQLVQVTEQLKSSQGRVSQLEAQLKQTPSSADLENARKQADDLQSQLAQATEQLKSSQGRVSQLEAQLKQTPSSADLEDARKQANDLQSRLVQATEQLKSSQGRVSQLEAQQTLSSADLDNARKQADDLQSQLSTAMAILKTPGKVETTALKNTSPVPGATHVVGSASDQDDGLERPGRAGTGQPFDSEGITGLSLSGSPSARPTAPASSDGLAPATGPTAVPPAQARPPTEKSPSGVDIPLMLARGDSLLAVGDITSARLFYERAANAGDGQAALRLGESYDPTFLERAQLRVPGDRALAVFWYRRARELGESKAEIRLKGAQVR